MKVKKSPEDILHWYDGKCPKCGRTLSIMPKKVEVKPAPERKNVRYILGRGEEEARQKGKNGLNFGFFAFGIRG